MSPGGRPAHLKECPRCLEQKPKKAYPSQSRVCSTCRNVQTIESRDSYRLVPADELARIAARVKPSAADWVIIAQAAERVRAYLFQKAGGASDFEGESGWSIIEKHTGPDVRRFHQLVTLATIQQRVWEEERAGSIRVHGKRVPKEDVQRMAALKKDKLTITTIAARTGYPVPTVSKILRTLTEPTAPQLPSENEREAAA